LALVEIIFTHIILDKMLNFASIDFETANYNRSSICSLGIVIVESGKIIDKIYRLVRPRPNFYCSWATDIHGLSYYDTLNEPEFPEVWEDIKPKLRDFPLVAHNASLKESCLI
jgi:DNA polymerase-3 subunit epsilon